MRGRWIGALLVVGAVLLAACTGSTQAESPTGRSPHAGGTLRLGMDGGAFFALDPQWEWSFSTWELFRCCLLRTLMSYDGTSGVTSAEPKPDLAAAPPDVSPDGLVWTFHLRSGLHYGPPLQATPITSDDIVRALLRAGDRSTANALLGENYLFNIQGFSDYMHGKADSISGLETPDPLTLRVRELRPDSTLPYVFTLPTTAPIPPSPSNPSAPYGVATGHDRPFDPTDQGGYGRFLVSSGPYMLEGEGSVDFAAPADQETPAAGFEPWTFGPAPDYATKGYGSITLVRNPSWDPSTDPLRQALADKIVLTGGSEASLFDRFESGDLDMVFDRTPPASMLQHYLDDASLRSDVQTLDGNNIVVAEFNVTRPPFDDPAVRLAVAYALDRAAMLGAIRRAYGFGVVVVANHYANDVSEQSLASGWNPFPAPNGDPDLAAARKELSGSRYGRKGRCVDAACRGVNVELHGGLEPVAAGIRRTLASLGIQAKVSVPTNFYKTCLVRPVPWGICVGDGWFPDFPSTGNGLVYFFGGPTVRSGSSMSFLGAPVATLKKLGTPVTSVPSVDPQIQACEFELGDAAVACWTRLDQYVITQLMPAVPLAFDQQVRLTSSSIGGFSWDEGFESPAIDRLWVTGSR